MKALQGITMKDLFPVIWLTVVVTIAVSALSVTDMVTRDLIEEARRAEIKAMLEDIFPEMDDFEEKDDIFFIKVRNEVNVTVPNDFGIDENYTIIGYGMIVTGSGYGGDIDIILGIDTDPVEPTIAGLQILQHAETPGLGAKIVESEFTSQFEGISREEAILTKNGGKIDAITSATISSDAVVDAVQDAIGEMLGKIEALREVDA